MTVVPIPPPITTWSRRGRTALRVAFRSGVAFRARLPGAWSALRQRAHGPLGIGALARIHGRNQPESLALCAEGRRWTFRQLDRRVDRLADGLSEKGLRAGDSALVALPNCAELIEIHHALARLGVTTVFCNPRSTADEYERVASDVRAFFVDAEGAETIALFASESPPPLVVVIGNPRGQFSAYESLIRRHAGPPTRRGGDAPVVMYTSGTTGQAKPTAARATSDRLLWALVDVLSELPLRADDRHLAVCPLHHATAFGFVSMTMALGGCVHILRRFTPEAFLKAIAEHRITTAAVVPTMLHRILELPTSTRRAHDTRSLRGLFSAGAPLTGSLARRAIDEFGHVLYNVYGSTETGLNTIATPAELLLSPGTIGHPALGNEIALLDENGHPVPDGQTGELFVDNAMLSAETATGRDLERRGRFISVGDLAHRDENGLYHLDGRKRDMIITGGVNVFPGEVEEVLAAHPEVNEAAVIGLPDAEWGERVIAFITLKDSNPASVETLRPYAAKHLSARKRPAEIHVMQALPKTHSGKVLKRELRARARAEDASRDSRR